MTWQTTIHLQRNFFTEAEKMLGEAVFWTVTNKIITWTSQTQKGNKPQITRISQIKN